MVTKIEELLSSNENTSKYLSSAQKNAEPIFYYCIFFSVLHKYFSSTENNK
jgi:hypothetical protein